MTETQKRLSLQMRRDGQTYSAIASVLGVPCGSVKSFVSRFAGGYQTPEPADEGARPAQDAGATSEPSADELINDARCRQCGKPLGLHNGNHMKRFCCENCRQKWWRAHKGEVTKRASTSVCVGCGRVFKNGGNPLRHYCSRHCYFDHRFQREGAV